MEWPPVPRLAGEFLVVLAIILGGAAAVEVANDALASPASEVATGLVVVAMTAAGVGWLLVVGPEREERRASMLAGLGGAVGVIAGQPLLGSEPSVGVGAAVGAGSFAAAGILWGRRAD